MTAAADTERPTARLARWAVVLSRRNEAWTFAILAALVAFFSIAAPGRFLTVYDITQIAVNASIYLVLGVGMTYVIITAGIDLSIGSVLVLAAVAAAEYNIHHGGAAAGWGTVAVCVVIALGVGAAWGALQGMLVATGRVPALIVTLGGMGAALGLAEIATGGEDPPGAASPRAPGRKLVADVEEAVAARVRRVHRQMLAKVGAVAVDVVAAAPWEGASIASSKSSAFRCPVVVAVADLVVPAALRKSALLLR